jgi:hypothetical protein
MALTPGVKNQAVAAVAPAAPGAAMTAVAPAAAEATGAAKAAVATAAAGVMVSAVAAGAVRPARAAEAADTPPAVPFQFGTAARASTGSTKTPGAFGLTWVDVRSHEEAEEIRLTAAAIAAELATEPGFISWMGLEIGFRLYTITAWETSDAVSAVQRNRTHQSVVRRFFTGNLGAAASTSVWRADHHNALWTRCPACTTMIDQPQPQPQPQNPTQPQADGLCSCGAPMPAAPDAW